jgi:hypothetical protein
MTNQQENVNDTDTQLLLGRMMSSLSLLMDELPEKPRLAVWFGLCLRFGDAETAEIMRVPEDSVGKLLEEGVSGILTALAKQGLVIDVVSLRIALSASTGERLLEPAVQRLMPKELQEAIPDCGSSREQAFHLRRTSRIHSRSAIECSRSGRGRDEWN